MDWKYWLERYVFVQLKSGGVYSGRIIDVDISEHIIFLTMIDKYGDRVIFTSGEIIKIKEEENKERE